ncbi:hypothetical protein N7509_000994 [Penicillium cosmopolitanum]|uniref:DH domain-containing protein n=1 Tax=Penicillium cosmopolitanum TaxID=1131564 RepID=A0A9W9WBN8_9EURO|nr:uncharacterized protein N7509_000994 [Penicillium cosmopolitanum]KAJ5414367.1 hypothetical protein N7509_000994 [Penicillium cosmopolitanum]
MVSRGSNQEFAEKTFSFHQRIYDLHKTFLYDPLLKRQEAEGPWITNFPDIFQRWLSEATPIYLEFCALYPRLHSAIKIEATKSSYFQRFLNQTRDHRFGNRLGWDTYMKSPIVRIQRYPMLFAHSLRYSERTDERHGYQAIEKVILDLQDLVRKCGVEIERAEKEVRMERLREQINSTLKDGIISPHANILFDEDLLYQKRGFGRVTQLRVVVLGPGDYSMVLILSKISKLTQINDDTDSYELVEQFDARNPITLYLTSRDSEVVKEQFTLVFSQNGHQPDLPKLSCTSLTSVKELFKAVGAIGGEVKDINRGNIIREILNKSASSGVLTTPKSDNTTILRKKKEVFRFDE